MSLTRTFLGLVVVLLMSLSADAGVCDGRIFSLRMLGDVNGNGKVDLNEVGNGMTVGNPAGWQKATRGNPATPLAGQEPILFESAKLPRAYWNASAVTNLQTFVRFPQTTITVGEVVSNANQAITVPYVPNAERPLRSGFFRFRWDGYPFETVLNSIIFGDGWTWKPDDANSRGCAFYVAPDSASVNRLFVWVGGVNTYVPDIVLATGVWYDVAYRFLSATSLEVTVRTNWTTVKKATLKFGHSLKFNASSAKVIIGGQDEGATAWGNAEATASARKGFRGAVAELELFDGTLSEEDISALFAGEDGLEWTIGSVNGSSHEFGGAPEAVYDPREMEWGKMRGVLTDENPSLTLKAKVRPNDGGLSKVLSIIPLLEGVGTSCPLTVTVNGQAVAALDGGPVDLAVAAAHDVFIPGSLWQGDSEGNVTVVLTRTAPVVGALAFDALTLSGSWQLGKVGDGAGEFARENMCPEMFFIGDVDTSNHLRKATYPIGGVTSFSNLVLRSWVPAQVAAGCKARFAMRISNAATADPFLFRVLIGGSVVWSGTVVKGDTINFGVPRGAIKAGYNDIAVQNWASADKFWSQYDYFRLDFSPDRGMVLIFR